MSEVTIEQEAKQRQSMRAITFDYEKKKQKSYLENPSPRLVRREMRRSACGEKQAKRNLMDRAKTM